MLKLSFTRLNWKWSPNKWQKIWNIPHTSWRLSTWSLKVSKRLQKCHKPPRHSPWDEVQQLKGVIYVLKSVEAFRPRVWLARRFENTFAWLDLFNSVKLQAIKAKGEKCPPSSVLNCMTCLINGAYCSYLRSKFSLRVLQPVGLLLGRLQMCAEVKHAGQ